MNVEDFNVEIPAGDMLETIFNHQRDLMEEYHFIEQKNTGRIIPSSSYQSNHVWHHAGPLNMQDRHCQLRAKEYAWWITEEITEATLALDEENKNHYLEELIDALHFSIELMIISGLDPDKLARLGGPKHMDYLESLFFGSHLADKDSLAYRVIEKLGEAMNRLKLKSWKMTAMLTDEKAFRQSLTEFFWNLIDLLKASGFTAKTATQMYLNKNAVNNFRIKSKY